MPDSRPTLVRFGPFVCDTSTGELWKSGRPIRLQEQPRQLLAALLQQPGTLWSRDELRRRLWTDGTFVDFDNALNVGIRKIREALADDAPTARYVETVRGHGYRFIAPVARQEVPAPPPSTLVPVSTPAPTAAGTRRWLPAVVAACVVTFMAAAWPMVWSARPEPRIDSLAVLPFDNLLADDERQYLVDGLSEALTRRLAARLDVRVITGRAAFAPTDNQSEASAIARRLGADGLLLGSVAREGAGAVINVRLVDRDGGRPRWTGRFERSFDELSLPDQIVEAVASGIGRVTSPARGRMARAVTPEARDAYLRGRFFWAKRGEANAVTAVRYLSTAIQLQRDYAEAWAGLADVYAVQQGEPSPVIVPWPGDSIEGGLMAGREALRLAPDLGEAHAALGKLYVGRRRFADAERSFAKAVELNPQYSTARQWYGTMFARLRRCDEALEQVQVAARLDPLTALVNESVGSVYLECGEPARAVEVFDAVLAMHPTAQSTRRRRAQALSRLGRHDAAIRELDAVASTPGESVRGALAVVYARAGLTAKAYETAATVKSPYLRAKAYAALRLPARMWPMLEQALAGDEAALADLLAAPEFEAYRHDRSFLDFAARAGFPLPIRDARFSATPR
jgi:TolB-like protein/DNA-binding winged helix-turn-helix (wHTH) protein/tetratricopeptide (TPR) repeat protein